LRIISDQDLLFQKTTNAKALQRTHIILLKLVTGVIRDTGFGLQKRSRRADRPQNDTLLTNYDTVKLPMVISLHIQKHESTKIGSLKRKISKE